MSADTNAGPLLIAVVSGPDKADRSRATGAGAVARLGSGGAALVDCVDPKRRWAVFDAHEVQNRLPTVVDAGFAGLAIRTLGGRSLAGRLPALIAALGQARQAGLSAGVIGSFEPPDLPRMLALRPDLIAVEGDEEALRAAIAAVSAPTPAARPSVTQRVFVRDLVVDLRVGAYEHEGGAPQRVRFDVEVDVTASPEHAGMADVFSYDVITDFVAGLPAHGHVALVETLAEDLAAHVLADSRAIAVVISVEKLDLGPYRAGVEITRRRGHKAG